MLAVAVAKSGVHLGRRATAFGIGEEYLRRLAPVENTELADTLVRHTGQRKAVLGRDPRRLRQRRSRSRRADRSAPARPSEAKKVIANLLAAPGQVIVTAAAIRVRLAPAANRSERRAIDAMLAVLNQRGLTLPRDRRRLPLRFEATLMRSSV